MGAHFAKLGRSLDGAVDAYNQTVGSLERQVLAQARALRAARDLGIEPLPDLEPRSSARRVPLAGAGAVDPARPTLEAASPRATPTRHECGNIEDHRYVVLIGSAPCAG